MISCASQPARCDGVVGLLGREKNEVKSGQGRLFDPQPGWGGAWHSGRGTPQPHSPTGVFEPSSSSCRKAKRGAVPKLLHSHGSGHASKLPHQCPLSSTSSPVRLPQPAPASSPGGLAWGLRPDLGLSIGSPRQKPSKHPSTETRPAQKAARLDVAQTPKPLQGGLAHLEPVPHWLNRGRSHLLQGACVLCSSLAGRNGRRWDKVGWIGISAASTCPPSQAGNGLFTQ